MFEHTPKAVVLAVLLVASACGGDVPAEGDAPPTGEGDALDSARAITTEPERQTPALNTGPTAAATLSPTEGHEAEGLVWFAPAGEEGEGVRIEADIDDVPAGPHGFHIHETGDCSAADASSAGGHFAPDEGPHGAPTDPAGERHVGDLGNLDANAEGYAEYDRVDPLLRLEGPDSIIGKAVVVHQMPDDLDSQPSGAAGPRIACGVIEAGSSPDGAT